MNKRLLSWLLTVAMLMGLVVVPASATDQDETNGPDSCKADGLYTFADVKKKFEIVSDASTVTITGDLDKVYDGESVDMTGKYTVEGSSAAPVVTYYADADGVMGSKLTKAPADAGTYWVKVSVAADTDFGAASAEERFTISPKSMEGAVVTTTDDLFYNGEKQTARIESVKLGSLTLTADDYAVTNNQQKEVGAYTLTVAGKGNYTGTVIANWKIAPRGVYIVGNPVSRAYDGTLAVELTNIEVDPAFIAGDDVQVKTSAKLEDPNVGKGKTVGVSIELEGTDQSNYTLENTSFTGYVDILPKNLTDVTVAAISDQTYTGSQIKPDVTVNSAVTLVKDQDYTVAYGENLNRGSASVTIAPKKGGNYTFAPVTVNFNIVAQASTISITGELNKVYDGESVDMTGKYTVEGSSAAPVVTYYADADGVMGSKLTKAPADASTYWVKVSVAADTDFGAASAEEQFTISPKSMEDAVVTITDDLVYNSEFQTAQLQSVKLGQLTLTTDDYVVTDNLQENAGTYTLTVTGKGNYTGSVTAEWHIAQANITVTNATLVNRAYNGTTDANVESLSCAPGIVNVMDDADVVGTAVLPSPDVGTYTVIVNLSLVGTGAGNYKLTNTTIESSCTVQPASHKDLNVDMTVMADNATSAAVDLSEQIAGIKGALLDSPHESKDEYNLISNAVLANNVVSFDVAKVPGAGKTAQLYLWVSSTNYKNFKIYVNITTTDKLDAEVSVKPIGTQYTYGDEAIPVRASAKGDKGTWTITSSDPTVLKIVDTDDGPVAEFLKSGTASITVAYDSPTTYGTITLPVITVKKAELVIKALDKTIDLEEKAPDLSVPVLGKDYTVTGLVGEDTATAEALDYNTTPDTTKEGTYQIKIMAFDADPEKYNVTLVPGTLTIEEPHHGGGGSSSGGGSTVDRDTVKNPDGSTTVTETKRDGTTVETTTHPNGDKTVVESKKDGSTITTETNKAGDKSVTETDKHGNSTTEVEQADGTTAESSTNAKGETRAEVQLSGRAVRNAEKTGEPAVLPIPAVEAQPTTEDAPVVKITTGSKTPVNVEIPVSNMTPGTVPVIVAADGTERVVPQSAQTKTGVVLSVEDGTTVKLVDAAKEFRDIPESFWAADAVAFVSARGLFNGTAPDVFTPNSPTTRGQLMTVLARLAGADTTGDPIQKGMEWAVENGISDGTNPQGIMSRQQLAAMLWRLAGEPESSFSLTNTDQDAIASYAETAMAWAVENGIMGGYADGSLKPESPASRAHVAAMVSRYINR